MGGDQGAGHRRPERDQLHGPPLGFHFERVQLLVILDDPRRAFEIPLLQAAHGFADGVLGQAAHFADQRAQPVEVVVECFERMSCCHELRTPLSRSGR